MNEQTPGPLAEALIASPAGAALLAALEGRYRDDWGDRPSRGRQINTDALAAAITSVGELSIGDLLSIAVNAGQDIGGSWWSDAPTQMARAIALAPRRQGLATAVAHRLGATVSATLDRGNQQIWRMNERPEQEPQREPLGSPREPYLAWVTATPNGLWSVTDPPQEVAPYLLDVWEYDLRPITRWSVTIDRDARVFEINDPDDWASLCTTFPLARPRRPNSSWELPGTNQDHADALASVPQQLALCTEMEQFVEPDWDAVADRWDGIHLSWRGFLTCEGCVIDLGGRKVAMLRNWNSERTLWLNPVLGDPHPLAPPLGLDPDIETGDKRAIDPRSDPNRLTQDKAWIDQALGLINT